MGRYTRTALLRGFVHGEYPVQVFGPDRESAAREIAAYLNGLEFDRMHAALMPNSADETRRKAYDNGVTWFRHAYYSESATMLREREAE